MVIISNDHLTSKVLLYHVRVFETRALNCIFSETATAGRSSVCSLP